METNTFYQTYTALAHQVLPIYQESARITYEYNQLMHDNAHYVEYLEKFDSIFPNYPALKTELLANLSACKTGAFAEFKLDLFFAELERAEELKVQIQQRIVELRQNFADETKEWLPDTQAGVESYSRSLDTQSIGQVTAFLTLQLKRLEQAHEKLGGGPKPEVEVIPDSGISEESERKRKQREALEKLKNKNRRKGK